MEVPMNQKGPRKRLYPGTTSKIDYWLELLALVIGIFSISCIMFFMDNPVNESQLKSSITGIGVAILIALIIISPIFYQHILRHSNLGKFYYKFSLPFDWPILGIFKIIIGRLQEAGYNLILIRRDEIDFDMDTKWDRFLYGVKINRGQQELIVLETKEDALYSDLYAVFEKSYSMIIRQSDEPIEPEKDRVVSIVGQILFNFEMIRVKRGYPQSIEDYIFIKQIIE